MTDDLIITIHSSHGFVRFHVIGDAEHIERAREIIDTSPYADYEEFVSNAASTLAEVGVTLLDVLRNPAPIRSIGESQDIGDALIEVAKVVEDIGEAWAAILDILHRSSPDALATLARAREYSHVRDYIRSVLMDHDEFREAAFDELRDLAGDYRARLIVGVV